MARGHSVEGLWIVRDADGAALLARVHQELYLLVFSSVMRASRARELLGAAGRPFLIVARNVRQVVGEARSAGARGFIVDYDAERAVFAAAHPLLEAGEPATCP